MADMCDHFREFMVEGTRLAKGAPEDLYDKVVIPSNSPAPAPPTCPPDKGAGHACRSGSVVCPTD